MGSLAQQYPACYTVSEVKSAIVHAGIGKLLAFTH